MVSLYLCSGIKCRAVGILVYESAGIVTHQCAGRFERVAERRGHRDGHVQPGIVAREKPHDVATQLLLLPARNDVRKCTIRA